MARIGRGTLSGRAVAMLAALVMLAASLLPSSAPVLADMLSWSAETIPSTDGYVLFPDSNVADLGVAEDGTTYVVTGNDAYCYKSTDGGVTWSQLSKNFGVHLSFVGVALDDSDVVAVANTTDVWISTNGGSTWGNLGTPTGIDTINDIDVSVEKSGNHFVAVAGEDGGVGEVWYYEVGGVGPVWTEASAMWGFSAGDVAGAVAFSPNFASDEVMVAVTATFNQAIYLQIFNFNQANWNTGTFADYPVEIVADSTDANVAALDSASISMAPDYLGHDYAMRLVFVGITTDSTSSPDEASGIFRMDDDDVTVLKDEKFIHSVAYDGTNLVAGHYDSTTVRRCADSLWTPPNPGVKSSLKWKRPGGEDKAVVAWANSDVVAGTRGDESAFAISRNDGQTFNDISLIDTCLDTLSDVAVSPDGSKVYLVSANETSTSTDLSLWRYASSWERILSVVNAGWGADNYLVRLAPDDPDVVYLADLNGTTIYYSPDGGETKWHHRFSRYDVTDLAIEGDGDVAYVLTNNGYVSKSTNSGFTWASKVSSNLTSGGSMIVSLGEDDVLVGSLDGKVSYSTNGGSTWTKLSDGMTSAAVQATATGLADGDFVFAAVESAGDYIYRWKIGEDDEWDEITAAGFLDEAGVDYSITGLVLQEGVLYAVGDNATDSKMFRSLDPTADDPSWSTVDSPGEVFNVEPSALRVSRSENITKLWAIDTAGTDELFSYKDVIVPLPWSAETIPSTDGYVLFPGADVADLGVASDNTTIYATDMESDKLYKSTNAGANWTELTNPAGATEPQLVAVASDNASILAIVADDNEVYASTDGGTNWDSLGTPTGIDAINDIDVSVEKSGNHFVAVAGEDGGVAEVWHYEVGAVGPVWIETSADPGFSAGDVAGAVAFSPNFASDEVMVAVTAEFNDAIWLQIFSFHQDNWNTGPFSDYPAEIVNHSAADADIDALDSASISMAPDYLGSDDAMRIVFVGITTDSAASADEASGIFRMDNDDVTVLKVEQFIHSVDFDGTNLVAGHYDSTNVRRCADPLWTPPNPGVKHSLKSPGGEDKVVVAWASSDVVAGTSGNASAFAMSTDNGTTFNDISLTLAGTDVSDFAVASDNTTIYAADKEADKLYRSANAGANWTELTKPAGATEPQLVAVAPDDENYIAIVADGTEAYISSDAGANWDTLGDTLAAGITTLNDLAISPEKGGKHTVAAACEDGGVAEVWHYEVGAVGADWTETSADLGFASGDVAGAVAFSPNFALDQIMVAVTADFGNAIELQIYSFNQDNWNTGIFADYPAEIVNHSADANVVALDSASISMAPDYLGFDDSLRVLFVGITTDSATSEDEASGIFRMDDDRVTVLKDEKFIHSVAYDGTNLVAGHYDSTTVRRCADPLWTPPDPGVKSSISTKRPGGEDKAVVAWVGSDVVAGTSGDESAFAISRNDGKTFNDISLIDTTLTTLEDVYVTPDDSKVYLVTNDGTADTDNMTDMSLWRKASSWERVLSVKGWVTFPSYKPYIVRGSPNNSDVLYVAQHGVTHARTTYYTTTGGETRWYARVSRYDIQDMAVESTDVAYVLTGRYVSKSTDGGFRWAAKRDTKLAGGKILAPTGATEPQLVAVAPDNANYIAIVADDNEVYISDDGGLGWDTLRLEYSVTSTFVVRDIALSVAKQEWPWPWGNHVVAVAGEDDGVAEVWYYEVGAVGAAWTEASADFGFSAGDVAAAVSFSPNFASDEVMVAITENDDGAGGTDNVSFQIFSFIWGEWNTDAGFSGYPVTIVSDDGITGLDSASISLAPDYLGNDDSMRNVFVGLAVAGDTNATATSGVYRLKDVTKTALKTEEQIHSVAYDGANLVTGAYDSTDVWRSADPMATTPTVNVTAPSDRPGGEDKVVLAWAGSNVVAGTSGNASAFAISSDNGATFTDISLTDTGTDVSDFAVAADDVTIYATDKESDKLYKSIDGGVSWTEAQDTPLPDGHMIVSLGVDKLLVSSTDGYVSYSTDGNSSWTRLNQQIESGALSTQVTANGLASGDYIYAASSKNDTKVLRWQVSASTNWTDMAAPNSGGYGAYGIALADGVLYVQTYNGTDSCTFKTTSPAISTPSPSMWSKLLTEGAAFNATPQSLKVSTGSTKLWSVDTSAPKLYSYTDTVPDIMVSPSSIYFGSIPVGSSSANWTVFVSNVGTANLTVSDNVSIVGPNADQFLTVSDNCSGQSLAPSDNATLEVAFSPTSSGNQTATLSIPSNDPDEATANVTLSGNGTTAPTPHTVNLTASPVNITANGTSISTIMAAVSDQYYNLVPDGTNVVFTTNHGSLGSSNVTKQTSGGVATASLTSESSTETMIATVTATADSVSAATAVFFIPAGGEEVVQSETEIVSGNGTMTNTPTGGDVSIDAIGDHNITTAKYAGNPGGTPSFNATGDYYDVHLDSSANVTSLTIEFCPAAPGTVIYYWNGASWQPCSNQGFSGGCIVVTITASTFPSLSDLTGLVFGSGLTVTPPPVEVGGEIYPMNKLAILAPWIVLAATLIVGGAMLVRRRRAQS